MAIFSRLWDLSDSMGTLRRYRAGVCGRLLVDSLGTTRDIFRLVSFLVDEYLVLMLARPYAARGGGFYLVVKWCSVGGDSRWPGGMAF